MNIFTSITLFTYLLSFKTNSINRFEDYPFIKEILNSNDNISYSLKENIKSNNNGLNLIKYYNKNNKLLGSIIAKEKEIEAIYYENSPSDEELLNFINFKENNIEYIYDYDNEITTNSLEVNENDYFKIDNKDELLYSYSSTYLNEIKLKNVPNYYNSQFNNRGCSPTTALMYFAYMKKYSSEASNLLPFDFPLYHDDHKDLIDSYIKNIGTDYFYTSINKGTFPHNIVAGYNKYFIERNLDYKCTSYFYSFDIYNDVRNLISIAANPLHVKITREDDTNHSCLAIGAKSIYDGNKNTYYITVNDVANNYSNVTTYKLSYFTGYYLIKKG